MPAIHPHSAFPQHDFGCVCLDCSGHKIADGAYELDSGGMSPSNRALARSLGESQMISAAAVMRQRAHTFRFTPGSLAAIAEAQAAEPLGFDWRGLAERQADGIAALEAELRTSREIGFNQADQLSAFQARVWELERRLAVAAEQGNHDWKGPTRPVLDKDGEPTGRREAASDPVAEQVHRVVGDVLAGKVLPAQREQLGDALSKAPKHAKSTASTDAPMPGKALGLRA